MMGAVAISIFFILVTSVVLSYIGQDLLKHHLHDKNMENVDFIFNALKYSEETPPELFKLGARSVRASSNDGGPLKMLVFHLSPFVIYYDGYGRPEMCFDKGFVPNSDQTAHAIRSMIQTCGKDIHCLHSGFKEVYLAYKYLSRLRGVIDDGSTADYMEQAATKVNLIGKGGKDE